MDMNNKRSNNRAVIYSRYSLHKKKDESENCNKQIEICQRYCDLNNYEVVGTYSDESMSGANPSNRPGLQLALSKAVKKQAVLVVHSLSSLAWNNKDIIKITERLEHAKAGLCSIAEDIDTTTDYGQHFFKTAELFLRLESDLASERISNTMLRQQRDGRRMSAKPPYGMQVDPDDSTKLIENDYEQKAIKRIIELYKEGTSYRGIARLLTEEDFKPRNKPGQFKGKFVYFNGKWRGDLIARIIRREQRQLIP